MELVQSIQRGAFLGGRRRENERTVWSFIRSLDGVNERI